MCRKAFAYQPAVGITNCHWTGFGSQTHFNRAFKAHYGLSPSTYRLTPISMQ
ncbi:helix-turn-helix domain-containing protein [Moraxella ovis]|uniref:helix-turn-helix domain-containing protein n=1 Tax=Moraxella ovis TaxID=29433 RepID=UPI0035A237D1